MWQNISKTSRTAAKRSLGHRLDLVEKSSNEMQLYKNSSLFLLIVAPNGCGPIKEWYKDLVSWLFILPSKAAEIHKTNKCSHFNLISIIGKRKQWFRS